MIVRREMGAGATSPPFLSVVTRCYERPSYLEANVQSLARQTCANYEQVFIVDDVGRGLHAANMALSRAEPRGDYVLVLDDDDRLADDEALAALAQAVDEMDAPDLLFFRADHGKYGLLPDKHVWKKRPQWGHVGSCDFISRRDVWQRYIRCFGVPDAGDFHYLLAIWATDPRVGWLDRTLAEIQRISKGRPE